MYQAGKTQVDKQLDIVKIVKTSIDVEILKKLYLLPRQRALYKKQKRLAFKIDSDYSSDPDYDSDEFCNLYHPASKKSILIADLKNTTDRRLLLGAISRDNDLIPRKAIREHAELTERIRKSVEMLALNKSGMGAGIE